MKCRIFDGSRGEHPPQSYACRFHWFFIIVSSTKYNLSFKNAIEKKYMFEIKNIHLPILIFQKHGIERCLKERSV